MEFIYENHRIYVKNSEDKIIVEATFPLYEKDIVVVDHTFVDPSLRGQGVASQLMHEVCKHVEKMGYKVVSTCPYAVVWFKKHKEYDYLVDLVTQTKLSPECKI
ncbi:MAG: N-acetyltransferase [Acholeplasmataceae bacterium]|nr:N-acetyltransferase [Acholeplasmataceae bacterium]